MADETVEYDPDDAYDAWMLSRETVGAREMDAAAIVAMNAQPADKAVQLTYGGEHLWAIRTSADEFVIREDHEYDPAEFGISAARRLSCSVAVSRSAQRGGDSRRDLLGVPRFPPHTELAHFSNACAKSSRDTSSSASSISAVAFSGTG
jgi:hypothetical protein